MPRTPEANQRIRAAQRAKILESARSVFARKGMAATITDIAAEAQISLGLAYRYFADKDEIFSELIKQTVPDEASGFQELVEMPGTAGERLAALISSIIEARGHREPLEAHQLLHHALDADAMPEEIRASLGKRYQMLLATMRQLIVEGQATGEVAAGDPDQLVAVMSACLDGLTRWALRDPEQFRAYVPDAHILLRLFQPLTDAKTAIPHKGSLRARGIGYDTGFCISGIFNRSFDPVLVRRELQIIHDDLHCNAIRLIGNDLGRLEFAADHAADLGMEIWFSPFPMELDHEEVLKLLADAAERAERIRRRGAEVVFVTGAELSLFNRGFLPGDSLEERVGNLLQRRPETLQSLSGLPTHINDFLSKAVSAVRERFGGKVTYASIPLENVDWTPFDIVSVDAHRTKEVAHIYQQGIRTLVAQDKPVAITEFGYATHRGAGDRGGHGGSEMIEYDGTIPVRLNGDYIRDEQEQATQLLELLDIFTTEGVDAAFVCTFACYGWPHRSDPREDLDMASWGIVKVLEDRLGETYPDVPWEPKEAFTALADYYRG